MTEFTCDELKPYTKPYAEFDVSVAAYVCGRHRIIEGNWSKANSTTEPGSKSCLLTVMDKVDPNMRNMYFLVVLYIFIYVITTTQ